MKPFLLLSSRAEDVAAEHEYAAVLALTGLDPDGLRWIRLEAGPMPELRLERYSGILLGGGPFTTTDPPEDKSPVQHRVEAELRTLLDEVAARDFPFLGACYGIGTLGVHQGGVVDRTYGEPLSCVRITLTPDGVADPLLAGLPAQFDAFTGHKEACRSLPPGAVLLATSPRCPVQMFRIRENLYATQFHPELDVPGILTRARVYQHAGYFPPDELDGLTATLAQAVVTAPGGILANFAARYG